MVCLISSTAPLHHPPPITRIFPVAGVAYLYPRNPADTDIVFDGVGGEPNGRARHTTNLLTLTQQDTLLDLGATPQANGQLYIYLRARDGVKEPPGRGPRSPDGTHRRKSRATPAAAAAAAGAASDADAGETPASTRRSSASSTTERPRRRSRGAHSAESSAAEEDGDGAAEEGGAPAAAAVAAAAAATGAATAAAAETAAAAASDGAASDNELVVST